MADVSGFHWLDYILFTIMLLLSLGIGIYAAVSGGKQKTTREFLIGNRQLSLLPVSASMLMSFVSGILVLGNTAEFYLHGGLMFCYALSAPFAAAFGAIIIVPILYPLNLTSSFEYLTMRYNSRYPRIVGDFIMVVSQILFMGVALFAPSTALEGATGFPDWVTIIICGVVATVYTSIGGMKAVVWTDTLQSLVFVCGVITVMTIGTVKAGGFGNIWTIAKEKGRLDIWNFNLNPFEDRLTFWSVTVGGFFATLGTTTNQTSVQRFSSVKNLKSAKWAVLLLGPGFVICFCMAYWTGLVVFAHYDKTGCDPLRAKQIGSANQLLPRFIMEEVNYPGLPGIFLSVLFAGALSTLSSSISALSAITWKDILEPVFPNIDENKKTVVTKFLSVVYGVAATCMAFAFKTVKGHVFQLVMVFVTGSAGPMMGMFLAGFFFPCVNAIGVSIGALFGLGFAMWLAIGQTIEKPYREYLPTNIANCTMNITDIKPMPTDPEDVFILYKISFLWFCFIGVFVTMTISLLVSALTGPTKGEDVDPRLMSPIVNYIAPCLPEQIRRKFWCNVAYGDADSFIKDCDGHLKSTNDASPTSKELKHVDLSSRSNMDIEIEQYKQSKFG